MSGSQPTSSRSFIELAPMKGNIDTSFHKILHNARIVPIKHRRSITGEDVQEQAYGVNELRVRVQM
jgi:hypothetical protein